MRISDTLIFNKYNGNINVILGNNTSTGAMYVQIQIQKVFIAI